MDLPQMPLSERRRQKAYSVALACLGCWDVILDRARKGGEPVSHEELCIFRKTLDDIETLDPAWALMLRESYAEWL